VGKDRQIVRVRLLPAVLASGDRGRAFSVIVAVWFSCSVVEMTRHESQVIFRMTSVIRRPMMGSARSKPAVTAIAVMTTASET
jgi:hypothetical protein